MPNPFQPPFPTASQFVGYPERVAQFERLPSYAEVNAACPGETSGSFLNPVSATNPDNGCQLFKSTVGLHTNYAGTQAAFAVNELASNKSINLVTLSIGGNDLLLLEQSCGGPTAASFADCVGAALPGVLANYGANLTAILTTLRAHYSGTLMIVKSYAPSADPLFVGTIVAMNQVMVTVGSHFGVKFADAFTSFEVASLPFQGDPCKAGLLVRLSQFPNPLVCDVHPSPLGRDILALTVVVTQSIH